MPTTKIPFKTAFSEQERHYAPIGSHYEDEWGYEIDKKGSKVLVKTGQTNIYEKIQEHVESTKLENILKAASIGDMSGFIGEGQYIDTTELPNNLIEARQQIQKLENLWNKLSTEQKAAYGNDLGEFIADAGKDSWMEVMGYTSKEEPTQSEEIKVETSTGGEGNE